MEDVIRGYVGHIIFRNEENGYTVLSVTADGDEVTVVGVLPPVHEGEYIEAEGTYQFHPTYGQQFRAERVQSTMPTEREALERYLAAGAVKGIGPALAARIIKRFGDDTLRILEEEPERLSEIKGISEKKAREIGGQIEERSQIQNALIFLSQYGISLSLGLHIYDHYQERVYSVIKENPYELAETIRGIGFRTADEIAYRAGISPDSEYRIRCGLLYVLSQASAGGHIYLPSEVLVRTSAGMLGAEPETLEKVLTDLSIERKLILKKEYDENGEERTLVYSASSFFIELDTARMLCDLSLRIPCDAAAVARRIHRLEEEDGMTLDDRQKEAVITAAESGIMILTGGPGTGKTTTINTMIRYFEQEGDDIALAAPTGRAAKRMTETTGCEASTIHRLLEVSGTVDESGMTGRFERNENNPLEYDVIIIDEVSMVDIYLMHSLLLAVSPGTRLILVGDGNQLPSVGPGRVLRDMINSGCFPVVTLTRIFRQAGMSDIVVNAHRINAGQEISLDNKSRDFFFLRRMDVQLVKKVILSLVTEKLPGYVDARPFDIQVLTPMRRGPLGVESLNTLLQEYMNPPSEKKRERLSAGVLLREGDKVMQTRNDYQLEWEIRGKYGIAAQRGTGVFNGDLGIVESIDPVLETVTVVFDEGRTVDYPFRQLDELDLAYAMTVHKAQGSEYPAVVIPLLGVPGMLRTRNLLYTAVTRARRCVVLTGDAEVFRSMVNNTTEENRYTTLAERIQELN